jgi:HTH-type transcriptional regulator / antitoxin HigA
MTVNIKPIRTEEQYNSLLEQIDLLVDCQEGSPEEDLLEVLSILADDYENKHYPISAPDPIDAIKLRAEELNLKNKDLAIYFGSASKASEVLNRKRPLTFSMVKRLYQQLGIPASILLSQ